MTESTMTMRLFKSPMLMTTMWVCSFAPAPLFAADCNSNGVEDALDLAGATSNDCNANAVPDECDFAAGTSSDCNKNGVPDECDIGELASSDCNTNELPDECDLRPLEWRALGTGVNGLVRALTVYDDGLGGGPALYAGGFFSSADGNPASNIAKWNGVSWSALGSGLDGTVYALTMFDDGLGGGPALYAGGSFNSAGGIPASGIARWDGTNWSRLSSGVNGVVFALAVYDDGLGGGPALFVAGDFNFAGGQSANSIAKWSGASWSSAGSGVNDRVFALTVFDDGLGGGPALYAGGGPTLIFPGSTASDVGRWDGSNWSTLGRLNSWVYALTVFDDGVGSGPALYAGGSFRLAFSGEGIAKLDGVKWSALGSAMVRSVHALTDYDDGLGGGPALYAGGFFTTAGDNPAYRIAKWDGVNWSALGSGIDSSVFALASFDDGLGGGPALYVGGDISFAGGNPASGVARWSPVNNDCNTNGVPDECESDCNTDGVPDDCEPDCNSNGVSDSCDVIEATATDCNANGRLDICELNQSSFSLRFDGVDDYADAGLVFDNLLNGFTIEAWVRLYSIAGKQYIFCKRTATPPSGFALMNLDGQLRFTTFGVQSFTTSAIVLSPGSWTHVAVTFDRSNDATFYVNGAFVQTISGDHAVLNGSGRVFLGRLSPDGADYLAGEIDEVRIWNLARNPTAIAATMESSLTGNEQGLVAYWAMGEGSGATSHDASLSEVRLTLTGATWGEGFPVDTDCNANGTFDACDITELVSTDCNANSLLDGCESRMLGDFNADNAVDANDTIGWAFCETGPGQLPPSPCESVCLEVFDFDMDGDVDLADQSTFQRVALP